MLQIAWMVWMGEAISGLGFFGFFLNFDIDHKDRRYFNESKITLLSCHMIPS
jgi:hypothetical protein